MNKMPNRSFAAKEYEMRREISKAKDELREMSEQLKKLEEDLSHKESIIQILYNQIDSLTNGEELSPEEIPVEEIVEEPLEEYYEEEYEYIDEDEIVDEEQQ